MPFDWLRCLVVVTDVFHKFSLQVGDRGEDTAGDHVTLDLGKPEFYLIEPGRIRRRVVQLHLRMRLQKLGDEFGFMGREIVRNDMNLPASGLTGHEAGEKCHELLTRVSLGGAADDRSGLSVQGSVQRERAMTVVFKTMPLCSSWRQRQYWIQSVQRLDAGLFIDTEDHRMLRRLHIQPDNVGRFLFKVRIVGDHVALDPVWLKPRPLPDSGHHHVMHPKVFGQLARAPVRRPIGRLAPRPFQNLGFQLRRPFLDRAARVARVQTGQPTLQKALFPTDNKSRVAGQLSLDRLIRLSFSQHENQSRPPYLARRQRARAGSDKKFFLFGGIQSHSLIGHAS